MDTDKVSQLINSLTVNEDIRQDLWIDYLSGTPISKLRQKALEKLFIYDILSMDAAAYELAKIDLPFNLLNLLSTIEKHIMFLLYLGYNISEISVTLGENRVVVLRLISSLKQNLAWNEVWSSVAQNVKQKKI